jgi:hypothetical protein
LRQPSSRLYRFIAFAAVLCLAPLGACTGPDLEPPFSGVTKPERPTDGPDLSAAAGKGAAGSGQPAPATSSGGSKASSGAGGAAGSRDADAGMPAEDAGTEP